MQYLKRLRKIFNDQLHEENVSHILETLEKHNDITILASWGGTVNIRDYFKKCLTDIYNKTKHKNIKWLKL